MTEMITIIAVGIGLAGVIWYDRQLWRKAREKWEQEMRLDDANVSLRKEINARLDQMDVRFDQMDARFEGLEARMGVMERQQAKLEGLLEGLREAISGRAPASR